MGNSVTSPSSSISDALFPKVRQRVLAVLFGAPDRSFYTNEVTLSSPFGVPDSTAERMCR